MDADHEIFNRPFKVELTTIQVEVPDNYRTYYDGKDLPETIDGWLVHEDYEKDGWGLVSDPYGFEDSPDCEYISSGTNSKSVRSVALGRQGNWFLWGFFAPPGDMTDEARLVFLNTVAYMKRFDGQHAYGEAGGRGREWALSYAHWLDDENLRSYAAGRFDPGLLAATDSSGVKLIELLTENIDYIYQDSENRWAIDEDARGLGIPGDAPANFPQILEKLWWRLDKALLWEDVRSSALVCLVDAIRHGTTTLIDHHASPNAIDGSLDVIAEAVLESGLRSCLCYEVTDRDGPEKAAAGIKENARFIYKAGSAAGRHPRLAATFGLHASLTLSDETLARCIDAAAPTGGGILLSDAPQPKDDDESKPGLVLPD